MRRTLALLIFALALLPARSAQAQPRSLALPPGFTQEVVARDLGAATAFAVAPDGRIFIARKDGSVKVYRDGALQTGYFVDLAGEINRYADRGLVGIAVHPDWPNPAWVYLAYAYEPPEAAGHEPGGARAARVLRVTADPENLDRHLPGSGVVLLGTNSTAEFMGDLDKGDRPPYSCSAGEETPPGLADGAFVRDCLPVDGPSHTVDHVAFGPDGLLYVSTGDATLQVDAAPRAQALDSLAGKILRVDPATGLGVASNPFFDGDAASNRSKVYALGVRNPFRFTFEPGTGRLVVGDVGAERWEEINAGGPGANFGWPCLEGPERNSGAAICAPLLGGATRVTHALHRYPHAGAYSAAIGGDYYVDDRWPAPYRGAYFFADHNRAALLALPPGGGDAIEFASNAISPVQLSRGYEGDLFMLSFVDGALIRIRYAGGDNVAPLAQAAAEPVSGPLPLAVAFSAQGSRDPDGGNPDGGDLAYLWEFGDGQRSAEPNPAYTYAKAGRYEVRLTVVDAAGAAAATTLLVNAGSGAPVARILSPAPGAAFGDGDTVAFAGAAQDPEDGPLPPAALAWEATLHHNDHIHTDYFSGTGAKGAFAYAAHGANVWMELCLTATDGDGVEGKTCVDLQLGDSPGAPLPEATPTNADARIPPAEPSDAAPTNGVRQEIWRDVGGTLADFAARSSQPDGVQVIPALDTAGQGKDYGEVLRALLTAPMDGAAQFWIAGDDAAELWLSPDADPAHAALIARVDAWTPRYAWDEHPAQASAPVVLEAGKDYFIEVRHKQADGKDNVAVAWRLPGGEREVIPPSALTPAP